MKVDHHHDARLNSNPKESDVASLPPSATGFVYEISTGEFTDVSFLGQASSAAMAINNTNTLVGVVTPYGDSFEQDALGRQRVIRPAGVPVTADDISDTGVVVGLVSDSSGFLYDFRWRNAKAQQIIIPGAPTAVVNGISPTANALVGTYSPAAPTDSFLYEKGAVQRLAYPGAIDTYAYGVNGAGQVSGLYLNKTGGTHAFIWTPPTPLPAK
ncbi:MAG: hypothetical protein H0X25_11660 [Acidobacteriales bacterium]|nr:hypothetical protein [Terriglobales bacterium]